jgi:hypothetical protein
MFDRHQIPFVFFSKINPKYYPGLWITTPNISKINPKYNTMQYSNLDCGLLLGLGNKIYWGLGGTWIIVDSKFFTALKSENYSVDYTPGS